jgi:hypothetical protein
VLTVATVLAVLVLPLAAVTAMLLVVGRVQRSREVEIGRQVAVTDAIHAELGAVVSPVVKRRLGRGWRIEIAVPFERPAIVGRVVAIAHAALLRADARSAARLEVVLTAQEAQVQRANVRRLNSVGAAPLATSEREVMAWTGTNTSRASS